MDAKSIVTAVVTGLATSGNPGVIVPLIIETAMGVIHDLRAKGQVTDEDVATLRQRITDVTNRFQDIEPFTLT